MQQESKTVYRVRAPLLAMQDGGRGSTRFMTLPVGAMIKVLGAAEPFHLVEVECEGELLTVFHRDIEERAEQWNATGRSGRAEKSTGNMDRA